MHKTTAEDLLQTNIKADKFIQDAIDFGNKYGYDIDERVKTSDQVDELIEKGKLKGAKIAGLHKIDERQDSDSEEEEKDDYVPAMIPVGRRREAKGIAKDAERDAISEMFDSMMETMRKTADDIQSRLDFEESKYVLESQLEKSEASVFLSASKLADASELVNKYSIEKNPQSHTSSKVLEKF